jgi:hypothetical protein
MENATPSAMIGELIEKINSLEMRINRIEEHYQTGQQAIRQDYSGELRTGTSAGEEDDLVVDKGLIESNIFEYGLAWFGSLVLLFGVAFLSNFARNYLSGPLATLVGYAAVGGVFYLAWSLRNSFTHMSSMLSLSAHLLLYYITLRLWFFTPHPVIPLKGLVLALMLVVVAVHFYSAMKRDSELSGFFALLLALATALLADYTFFSLPVIMATAGFSVFLLARRGWWRLMSAGMILVYITQGIWLLNNPVMGNPVGAFPSHPFNLISLFVYGTIFSIVPVIRQQGRCPDSIYPSTVLINGISFSTVLLFVVVSYYAAGYVWIFTLISALCLFYSVFLKFRTGRIFDPAFFAIYSFMALSIAVYGYSGLPDALWLLALQSLIVVSWALWFRSKIIVVMNTILFAGILLIYMAFYPPVDKVNIAFVITAFVSARIINWKKERLTLKTEMIRNTYLITLFFTMLFALYHGVAKQYVTLSWTGAAVLYFVLSLILRNIKYRWMAIATVLFTGFYLFFVDLSHLETGYRVLAFLFLAAISLGASVYFTKKVRKRLHQGQEKSLDGATEGG